MRSVCGSSWRAVPYSDTARLRGAAPCRVAPASAPLDLPSMPFSLTVHHGRPHLLVQAGGVSTLADLCGAADLVAAVTAQAGYRRALLDLTATDPQLSFTQHLQLGAHVAQRLSGLERVATVVSPANRTGTSEKAAQKAGLRLRTFTDLAEAIAWLEEEPG